MLLSGSRCLPSCGANDYQSTFCGRLLSPIVRIPNFLQFFGEGKCISSFYKFFGLIERQSFFWAEITINYYFKISKLLQKLLRKVWF